MSILHKKPKAHAPASQPSRLIRVISSSGDPAGGPTVELGIQLPELGLLSLTMRRDEADDLANELLAAAAMAQRKHEQQFGTVWNSTF